MLVAPDGGEACGTLARKGVNEYYVPCIFSGPWPRAGEDPCRLIAARPVGVDERGLLVEPLCGDAPSL